MNKMNKVIRISSSYYIGADGDFYTARYSDPTDIDNEYGLDYLGYVEYVHDNNLQELRRCVQRFRDSK